MYDAVIIGSGPNGLAAGIELARNGWSVQIVEGAESVGGGARSAELTLPGFVHDTCSAVHPLAYSSPFFRTLSLDTHGLRWVQPDAALAHPFDDRGPAMLFGSVRETAATLGRDESAYNRLLGPLVDSWEPLMEEILKPIRMPLRPALLLRFARHAVSSARALINSRFSEAPARAVFAGCAAHGMLPLERPGTSAFGLVLTILAHSSGWPFISGGTQRISDALVAVLRTYGGAIKAASPVAGPHDLPSSHHVFFDMTPRQIVEVAGPDLNPKYRARLERYRYGPGVFKIDWALSEAIPWKRADCCRAGTLHLGGEWEEIAAAERLVWRGVHPERPFVLLTQPSRFDPTRAPKGKHTAWAYCHVPAGSDRDMTEAIEAQVERFAPGFRDCIIGRSTRSAVRMERENPNYVGGDINGGAQDLLQLLFRPVRTRDPYRMPGGRFFVCSSSTPPGGGVHGMCGYHAARSALRHAR